MNLLDKIEELGVDNCIFIVPLRTVKEYFSDRSYNTKELDFEERIYCKVKTKFLTNEGATDYGNILSDKEKYYTVDLRKQPRITLVPENDKYEEVSFHISELEQAIKYRAVKFIFNDRGVLKNLNSPITNEDILQDWIVNFIRDNSNHRNFFFISKFKTYDKDAEYLPLVIIKWRYFKFIKEIFKNYNLKVRVISFFILYKILNRLVKDRVIEKKESGYRYLNF